MLGNTFPIQHLTIKKEGYHYRLLPIRVLRSHQKQSQRLQSYNFLGEHTTRPPCVLFYIYNIIIILYG